MVKKIQGPNLPVSQNVEGVNHTQTVANAQTTQIESAQGQTPVNNQFEVANGLGINSQITPQIEDGNVPTQGTSSLLSLQISEAKVDDGMMLGDAQDARFFESYANSQYSYNDAEVLSDVWGMDVFDAKLLIGQKVDMEYTKVIDETLANAAQASKVDDGVMLGDAQDAHFFDSYLNSDYTYQDAETLAKSWGISVSDAKLTIGQKVDMGSTELIEQAMMQASKVDDGVMLGDAQDARFFENYVDSKFNYDDAAALADFWGLSVSDAKLTIGQKVEGGQTDSIEWALNQIVKSDDGVMLGDAQDARFFENYANSPFTYDDANTLAGVWGMDVAEAKLLIGHKLELGQSDLLKATLNGE